MKRFIAIILTLIMVLSMCACGAKDDDTTTDNNDATGDTTTGDTTTDDTTTGEQESDDTTTGETEGDTEGDTTTDTPAGDTLGTTLLAAFTAMVEANPDMTAQEIADQLITNPAILFSPATMPVEPGLLTGFDNFEVTGFDEGVVFMPMIGSIAFVGYVFKLPADADVDAFISNLEANCNPRWNICVTAEETVTGHVGNTVFFVMCPTAIEG